MAVRAGGDGGSPDLSLAAYRWLLVIATAGGLWLTHKGFLARTPAGADVMAHVARTDAGMHLLRHGRTDGWFPVFGSGYRLFAVYGPGLTLASAAVRVASLGVVHPARSFAVLGSVSIALLPPAMAALCRELGLTRRAAAITGVLALFVGASVGGGLAGLYGVGLVPQAVAAPAQLLVLAGVVRIVRTGSVPVVAATALGVGWLLILHPISLLVLVVIAPGLLVTVPTPWPARRLLLALGAGAWGAAVAAFWLVPAIGNRALRGELSAFDTPTLGERLGDVLAGDVLYPTALAVVVAVALALALGRATRPGSPRRWLAAPLTGLAYLVAAHLIEAAGWAPRELWVQLPNRGLVLAGYLLLVPVGVVAAKALAHLREPLALRLTAGVVVALAVLSPFLLSGPLDPRQSAPAPTPDLQAVGRRMKADVALSSRVLFVEPSPFVPLGTAEPVRWLASASGRNTAQLYFAEATRHPGAGVLPARVLATVSPADALGPLRRAGITHVVVTTPDPARQLDGQPGYRLVETDGPLAVYEVQADPRSPEVDALLQPDGDAVRPPTARLRADLIRAETEAYRWRVDADPGPGAAADLDTVVVAPVAQDPGWHATVDGRPVPITASSEGLVRFAVPPGRHDVRLEFTGARNDVPALTVSVLASLAAATVLGRCGLARLRARRRRAGTIAA